MSQYGGQQDPSQQDPSQYGGQQDDQDQSYGGQQDPSQQDPSHQDPSQYGGQQDSGYGGQDPSQQDPSQQDPSQQDPSQQDPSQQDPSQQDPSQQDPSQQYGGQQQAQTNGYPSQGQQQGQQQSQMQNGNMGMNQTDPSNPPMKPMGAKGAHSMTKAHPGSKAMTGAQGGKYGQSMKTKYGSSHHDAMYHAGQTAAQGFTSAHMESFLHLAHYTLGALGNQNGLTPDATSDATPDDSQGMQ